ncbi:MAG TPA: hypothetical protein V6C97_04995 [Oculatellaceae cyanobacterium]
MSKARSSFFPTPLFSALFALMFLVTALPARPQSLFDKGSLEQRFDFIITVQTQVLKGYMSYQGSTLNPITQLTITYQETPRLNQNRVSKTVQYEDLWYHNCHAIGCRRYNVFQIEPGEQGAIRFVPSADASNSGCAIANATTRLLLDIGLNKSSLAAVFVPADAVGEVTTQFEQFNFHPYTPQPDHGIKAAMALFICSEPEGTKQYMYYDGSNL